MSETYLNRDKQASTVTLDVPAPSKLRTFSTDAVPITVRGRLGSNVDVKVMENGVKLARVRLAVTRRGRDETGNWHDASTAWFTVKMRGQLAQNASASLSKGQPVVVQGRLEVNEWSNPKNGSTGVELLINATTIGHDLVYGTTAYSKAQKWL